MRRNLPPFIYTLVLALFPTFSLYIHNLDQLRLEEVAWTILALLLVVLAFMLGFWLLFKNIHKAAIITSVNFLLFFSFGHANRAMSYMLYTFGVLDSTKGLVRGEISDIVWVIVWLLLMLTVSLFVRAYKKPLLYASQVLFAVACAVLITMVIQWMLNELRQPRDRIDAWVSQWVNESPNKNISVDEIPATLPDIYYIILDSLGSSDTLETYYQTDLSDFQAYLENKGFYIAKESRSNYAWTELSLASSLNFMYLDHLRDLGADTSDTTPLEIMVEKNHFSEVLRGYGYQFVTFYDQYSLTNITSSDVYLAPQGWVLNGFQNELFNTTPMPILFRLFSLKSPYTIHRDHVNFMFETLDFQTTDDHPMFVFAHFLPPHPPFVFGINGEPVFTDIEFTFTYGVEKVGRARYISGYRDQVYYMTNKLMEALEEIFNRDSNKPFIIIIQGDHGPGLNLDWISLENTDINERTSIFNAYYFYDKEYQLLDTQISPVNSFRVILKQYFKIDLPLLDNKSYFTLVNQPYNFLDVTDHLSHQSK